MQAAIFQLLKTARFCWLYGKVASCIQLTALLHILPEYTLDFFGPKMKCMASIKRHTTHTACTVNYLLKMMFSGRIITRYGDVEWHPRSPDLIAYDCFLWGYLKSRTHANQLRSLDQNQINIRNKIAAISTNTLQKGVKNVIEIERYRTYIACPELG